MDRVHQSIRELYAGIEGPHTVLMNVMRCRITTFMYVEESVENIIDKPLGENTPGDYQIQSTVENTTDKPLGENIPGDCRTSKYRNRYYN